MKTETDEIINKMLQEEIQEILDYKNDELDKDQIVGETCFEVPVFEEKEDDYLYEYLIPFVKLQEKYLFCSNNFNKLQTLSISVFNFSVRTFNCLHRAGFEKAVDFIFLPISKLFGIRNMGEKSVKEIYEKSDIPNLAKLVEGNNSETDGANLLQTDGIIEINNKKINANEMSVRAFNVLMNNNITNALDLMALTKEDILSFKNSGSKTQAEILNIKKKLHDSEDYFFAYSNYLFSRICKANISIPLECVASDFLRKEFLLCDLDTVEDLININEETLEKLKSKRMYLYTLAKLLENDIKELSIKTFEECIRLNDNGTKENKGCDRNICILSKRANGETLEASCSEYKLTRERTRQIEKKQQSKFDQLIVNSPMKEYIKIIFHKKLYVSDDDILTRFNNYGNIFLYLLKNCACDDLIYSDEIVGFIKGKNWVLDIERQMLNMPNTFFAIMLPEFVETIRDNLLQSNICVPNEIILSIITNEYTLNGEIYTKKRLSLLTKYRIVLEKYFHDGINVYDDFDLSLFRSCYNKTFSDKAVPENNRALIGRIIDNCVLIGRGRYALKKDKYISEELLNDIYEFIENYNRDIIMTNTIFAIFNERLIEEGVENKYHLQGILRQNYESKYLFSRDYISKSNERRPIYSDIVQFIRQKQDIVSLREIKEEFPGVPDVVIGIALSDLNVIALYNKSFIHAECLDISKNDKLILKEILEELLKDGTIIDSDKLISEIYIRFSDFVSKNNITGHFMMYSIAKYLFDNEYQFRRPFIANIDVEIGSRTERILSYVEQFDEITITDIKDFIDDQGIQIYSLFDFINSLDNFIRIDRDVLKRIEPNIISEEQLESIKEVIKFNLSMNGYISTITFDYFYLPNIDILWNQWSLQSIINRFLPDICMLYSSNSYNNTIAIIIDKEVFPCKYEEFLINLIRNDNEDEKFNCKTDLKKWILNKGLINKELPLFLYDRGVIEEVEDTIVIH